MVTRFVVKEFFMFLSIYIGRLIGVWCWVSCIMWVIAAVACDVVRLGWLCFSGVLFRLVSILVNICIMLGL